MLTYEGVLDSIFAIAAAETLAVVSIDSPSELNSRAGGTTGTLCRVTQNVAGANEWTIYFFDSSSSASVNSPYVLASSDSGQWIAVAGKYANGARSINGTLTTLGQLTASAISVVSVAVSSAASITGSLSAGSLSVTSAASITGTLSAASLSVISAATIGSSLSAASISVPGALSAGSASVTSSLSVGAVLTASSATLSGSLSAASANIGGALTASAATFASATISGLLTASGPATIAALRALTGSQLSGEVFVEGFYSANDGGHGVFHFNSSSSATQDGGTVITPTAGTGRWLREFSGPVNVRWFGAVADGSSHPLSGYYGTLGAAQAVYPHAVALTDEIDGVAIQAAINASRAVYAPVGTYLVNVTLDPATSNQWLVGDGINASGGTVIKWNGATGSTIIKAPGGASRLDGIKIDGNSVGTVSGIVSDSTHQPGRAFWGSVDIANCPTVGLDLSIPGTASGIYYNNFGAMRVQSCGTGVKLKTTSGATAKVNANTWTHLVTLNNTTGLEINLADGNAWLFVDSENNSSIGIDVVKGSANVIWGGWLEANTTWNLRIADNPDVENFAYYGNCTQDSKVSYTNSDNRSVVIPTGNSYHWRLGGRWYSELIQMQDASTAAPNYCKIQPNSIQFNRSSSAGYSFVDQLNTTSTTGFSWRVSVTAAGDTTVLSLDNAAVGGRAGWFGSTPAAKQTITGSRAGNAALASLLGGLSTLGLITDSTSA